jgi:hypothetical protein
MEQVYITIVKPEFAKTNRRTIRRAKEILCLAKERMGV